MSIESVLDMECTQSVIVKKMWLIFKTKEKDAMKKWIAMLLVVGFVGALYSTACMLCIAANNDVSEDDYGRLARQIVDESLQPAAVQKETCLE